MQTETVQPFPIVGVQNPITNVNARQAYVLNKGGKYYSQRNYNTQAFSTSQWTFNTTPPSTATAVHRLAFVEAKVQFVADQPFMIGTTDAPRENPIGSVTNTLQVSINSGTITQNLSDYVHPLFKYNNNIYNKGYKYNSCSPCMPDSYFDYSLWTTFGSARNPLSNFGENSATQNRGGFRFESLSDDHKTVVYRFMEPFWFQSPWCYDGSDQEHMPLINVNSIDLTWNFVGDLSRMWSHDSTNGNAITNIAVTFPESPLVHFTYISLPDTEPIPRLISYPYQNLNRFPTACGVVNAGVSSQVTSDNIQLKCIPKRAFMWIREQNSDLTYNSTDTYASITNLNVSFNNMTGLLSSCNQFDLYQICLRNGLECSYSEFKYYIGSVMCIEFGTDIGLSPTEAPGVSGGSSYNFQVIANFTNQTARNINYTFYILIVDDGLLSVSINSMIQQNSFVTKQDVLNSDNLGQLDYSAVKAQGGSVFGKLKSFINTGSKIAQNVGKFGKFIDPRLGILETVGNVGRELTGGRRRRRKYRRRGRGLVGAGLKNKESESEESDNEQ